MALVFFLTKKYNLSKEQKNIFWLLVLFWSAISIIRAYRKLYAITPVENGGLSLTAGMAAQIAAGYGLMSLFVRLPMFVISDFFKVRKIFIQIALLGLAISSVVVFYNANYNTLYFSSLAMGLGATMLAMFNVIFSETFDKNQAIVSVSILSAAPLLAEFLAAPIQYLFTYSEYKYFNYMWLVAGILAFVTFFMSFSMNDYISKDNIFSKDKVKVVLSNKSFIYICIMALLLSFIKFSTSGANMLTYGKSNLNMSPAMLAYMDTVFAVPQLISGILVGTYLNKKFGIRNTMLLLFSSALIFFSVVLISNNMYVVYCSYIFNGFFYGGVYNILISLAIQYFDKEYRNISMGIYQAFFALGIYYGDYIYVLISKNLANGLFGFEQNKAIFLVAFALSILSMFMILARIKNVEN